MTKTHSILALMFLTATTVAIAAEPTPAPTPAPEAESEAKQEAGIKHFLRAIAPSFFDENDPTAEPATMDSDAAGLIRAQDMLSDAEIKGATPWHPPDFSGQQGLLGWSENAFEIPKGLESRVAFWRDIYTKYTTEQGLLHDRDDVSVVYEELDFSSIMNDPNTNVFQKAREREKVVKQRRKALEERLKRLHGVKSPEDLSGEDLRLWKLFEPISDADKFKDAASRGRIRFQLGQKDRFLAGIYHSGRYLRQMERIFREEGLPIELTRLPFVESSFNIHARSKVGASGVWQFMRRTARSYLKINSDVDERNDPLKATRASARLLRSNYALLQSWPLAVTGYNHGPNGVHNITRKMGTRDLGEIVNNYSSRRFGFASENFYACFLAALEVERDAKKFFGDVKWGPEVDATEVKLKKPLPFRLLTDFFDGDSAAAALANPHLLMRIHKGRAPVPARSFVRVPPVRVKVLEEWLSTKMPSERLAQALKEAPLAPETALALQPDPLTSLLATPTPAPAAPVLVPPTPAAADGAARNPR